MQVEVIILERTTTRRIAAWRHVTDKNRQLITVCKDGARPPTEEAWRQLALDINRLACSDSRNGSPLQADVFLLLRGELLENLYDNRLAGIVRHARDYTWDSNIYVAWDQASFNKLYGNHGAVLKEWFRALVKSGVTDLIEITKREREEEPDEYQLLSRRALESEERRARLRTLVGNDGWRVILREGACFLEEFIERFVRTEFHLPEGDNLAVFYDQRPFGGWGHLLRRARELDRGGGLFLAALDRRNAKDLRDLDELWGHTSAGSQLFVFKGSFEWLYSFIRLSQAGCPPERPPRARRRRGTVEWVEPSGESLFQEEPDGEEVSLLVTHAFHLPEEHSFFTTREDGSGHTDRGREADYLIAAAKEVGGVMRNLPFNVSAEVRHCVTCESLPNYLEVRPFTAWLHIGHGKRGHGLREARTGQYVAPRRWLDCFNAYGGSLQLAVFSACESADTARLFAESGARVAVGFGNEVLVEATEKLSEKVLPAALRRGDRRAAVLDAFREAFDRLYSHTYPSGGRYKHYTDAAPQAFAAAPRSS